MTWWTPTHSSIKVRTHTHSSLKVRADLRGHVAAWHKTGLGAWSGNRDMKQEQAHAVCMHYEAHCRDGIHEGLHIFIGLFLLYRVHKLWTHSVGRFAEHFLACEAGGNMYFISAITLSNFNYNSNNFILLPLQGTMYNWNDIKCTMK